METMSFVLGGLFVAVSILGGGIEIRELKIPPVNQTSRMLALVAGAAFVGLAMKLHVSDPKPIDPVDTKPAASIAAVPDAAQTDLRPWFNAAQYQKLFDSKLSDGFYPVKIDAKCEDGSEHFRADWKALPLGYGFVSRHGITEDRFARDQAEFTPEKGYSLGFLYVFKDCSGTDRYQATWLYKWQ